MTGPSGVGEPSQSSTTTIFPPASPASMTRCASRVELGDRIQSAEPDRRRAGAARLPVEQSSPGDGGVPEPRPETTVDPREPLYLTRQMADYDELSV